MNKPTKNITMPKTEKYRSNRPTKHWDAHTFVLSMTRKAKKVKQNKTNKHRNKKNGDNKKNIYFGWSCKFNKSFILWYTS